MTSPDGTLLGGDGQVGSNFLLEIDGVEIGIFATVKGLNVSIAVEEIVEGGQNGYVHKVPGRISWPNIVLSRGLTKTDNLFTWFNKSSGEGFAAAGNKVERATGAITALASDGSRLRSWNLSACFPVRWSGPDFDVSGNSVLSEELEIAHEGFRSANQT